MSDEPETSPETVPDTPVADTAVVDTPAPEKPASRRLTRIAVGLLGVLAVVGLLASTLAVWARTTLADSERFGQLAEDVISEPAVVDALATRLTDEIVTALALEDRVDALLPPVLGPVGGLVVSSVEAAMQNQFVRLLSLEATQQLVGTLVEKQHAAVLAVLRGDALPDAINVDDDTISVNMLPVLTNGLTSIQERFGIFTEVAVPELSAGGNPAEQVAELEAAFGVTLPPTFGQLVIYEGEAVSSASQFVQSARDLVKTVNRWIWVLIVLTVALFVASIALSRRRTRAVLLLAVGSAVALVAARWLISRILSRIPEMVAGSGARATVRIAVEDLVSGLRGGTTLLIVLAVAVAGVAFWSLRRDRDDAPVTPEVTAG
jgi:hypothetical protein